MSLTITTTLSLSSQSVANNTSTVTWKVKYSKSSSTYNNNGVKYYVNVDGNRVKSGTWTPKKGTTSGTIASGTTTIKHNADGTHAQIRAYAKVYDTGFSPSSADDYSPYLSLPTIKRTYTVSYNANGGTGAPASQTKTYGVNLTLSSTIPTRAGYAFKGWATSSTGAVAYQAGGTYTANSAVTLYAVWELLGNVKIESYSAIRCDESGNAADEGTWGKFTCTYILSGQGVNEGSVTGRYRASDVSTWTDITNITHGEHSKAEGVSSLSVNVSCLISNLSQDKSYLIELTVTDSYGNTAIASDYISQAYFTMDFLAGGKGIGIGTTASCDESVHPHGLLTCAMDADFKGTVNINGLDLTGVETKTLLWENASPTSAFAAQDITLPTNVRTKYDFYEIVFADATNGVNGFTVKSPMKPVSYGTQAMAIRFSNKWYFHHRSIWWDASVNYKLHFDDNYYNLLDSSLAVSKANDKCIPLRIYGIKEI